MSEAPLTKEQFPDPIPDRLLEAINAMREKSRKLHEAADFCREHRFELEEMVKRMEANVWGMAVCKVCNALGKFF